MRNSFTVKYLVTFSHGACVVSAPDPSTAIASAAQMYPEEGPYNVYKATKEDERIVNMPLPQTLKRVKPDRTPLPFAESTHFRGLALTARNDKEPQ